MVIELNQALHPAKVIKTGNSSFNLAADKKLKINTTGEGGQLLDETVPSGKVWSVYIHIDITETDA